MNPVVKKFSRLYDLSEEEKQLLTRMYRDHREIESRTVMVSAGDSINHAYLVQEGWAMIYKDLPNGEQQVLSFAVPGDFLGLFSIMLGRAEYTIETISSVQACELHWEQMMELLSSFPRLAMAICWFGARDQVMLREHVARIGRQSAFNRIGHIFLELFYRLEGRGLTHNHEIDFPVTQEMLANALGLTPIHISRTLKKLKSSGLIEMSDGKLIIPDTDRLAYETSFDNRYLRHSEFPEEIIDQPDISVARPQ